MRRSMTICMVVAMVAMPALGAPPETQKPATPTVKKKPRGDLANRLLRKAKSNSDEGLMESVLRLMDEASTRMGVDFDAGERTVEIQEEIAVKLNEAIEQAAKQRRPRRRSSSQSNRDKRRMPTASKGGAGQKKGSATGQADGEPANSAAGEGTAEAVEAGRGEFAELRRGWGHLPSRERDELIQGIEEQHLERYRDWIERYYRALQELDE
jgi:hypothetical protein